MSLINTSGPLYVNPDHRVSLAVRQLTVSLKNKESKSQKNDIEKTASALPKKILNDINFDLQPGKVLAILGSSGSGKTTLLNTLSSRMSFNTSSPFAFEGMIKYNEKAPNLSYLLQEDLFVPGLNTYEMLNYTALLKLPNASSEERTQLIDFLLDSLHLNKVRDTIITNFRGASTLSGGEKRRVSLALQLLTKPSILFLDEPTTGLDANTSINLITMVKKLSIDFGITVILTIHQPRVEILQQFDQICLLAKGGSMLYYGDLQQGASYFSELDKEPLGGDMVNDESNFADFLLKISSVDKYSSAEIEAQTMKRVEKLIKSWKEFQQVDDSIEFVDCFKNASSMGLLKPQFQSKSWISPREIYILFRRTILLTLRDVQSAIMLIGVTTLLSIIVGWVFYKPAGTLAGIRSITSTLYVCCETIGFTPLTYEMERLCSQDGKFLIKEYKDDKLYSLTSWFIGRKLAKLILEDIPVTLVWSIITYFMWGLDSNSNFGIFFINNLMIYIFGMATAHICFVLGDYQFPFASLISAVIYQFQNSACGYFVNAKTMPVYVRWTKYVAPFWYSFGSLVSNQFTGYMGDCSGDDCDEYSGRYVLETLGYPEDWYAVPLVVNLAFFVVFYALSAVLIWFKCNFGNTRIVKERKGKAKHHAVSAGNTELEGKESVLSTKVTSDYFSISVRNIILSVKANFLKSTILRKPFENKTLLNNLNVEFKPGLTAIMGPSGSGKTTMLNLISGRTKFAGLARQGDILVNETIIPFSEVSKLTSYVVQDDSCLIPVLTVRETLYYQAKLRLDESRHSEINYIIYRLMKKMGLLDVMNLPIGDYRTKGISGGEKRRLSVAVQLLNEDNRILLLDEPTSGLDSFTSQNLICLLKELSEEYGKIIIMTIHQPKYEIFEMFDKIVLLKDGNLIYDGDTQTLIEDVHFDATENDNNNFADYLMDVLIDDKYEVEFSNIKKKVDSSTPNSAISVDSDYSKYKVLFQQRQRFNVTFWAIFRRELKVILRTEGVLFSRVGQYVGLSILHALYFSPLRNNSESISNRLGLIQEVLNLYFVGLFNNMSLYPIEKATFYQEYKDNLYSPAEFMLTYFVNEFPMEVISNFILSIFVVLVIGLPRTPEMFFTMCYMCILSVDCGESIGIVFNTMFDQLGIAINVLANVMVVGIFMGGTMSLNMPILFRAFNYINPLKYAVLALAQLGLEGQKFSCTGDSSCVLSTGEQVLGQYNLNSTLWVNFVAIAAIAVVYRLVALLCVSAKVRRS